MPQKINKQDRKKIGKRLKGISGVGDIFNRINTLNLGQSDETVEDIYKAVAELETAHQKSQPTQVHLGEVNPSNIHIVGRELINKNAVDDMSYIDALPYVRQTAIMADGHRVAEKSVPVGGVVVTDDDTVIPAVVGSDISCSVMGTFTNVILSDDEIERIRASIGYIMRNEMYFGRAINPDGAKERKSFLRRFQSHWDKAWEAEIIGAVYGSMETSFGQDIFDRAKKMADSQFSTSGDGNHFMDIGLMYATEPNFVLNSGGFSIVTHWGSRGIGALIASAFQKAALENLKMPDGVKAAPLDLNSRLGRDYWQLMTYAGNFAWAGHLQAHYRFLVELEKRTGISFNPKEVGHIYSRHNYAWKTDNGIVHRKGATPAAKDQYGLIPATMGDGIQVIAGLGNPDTFESAPHGGGRTHSRGRAIQEFGKDNTAQIVKDKYNVDLYGGGPDEDPRAYKSISKVIEAHEGSDLVLVGKIQPIAVRMADPRF